MNRYAFIAYFAPLLAISACSSGPETEEACIERFSDDAELIDFLNNDVYGATYTYEFEDFEAFNEAFQTDNGNEGSSGAQFRIANGKASMTVEKTVPNEKVAVAFGCHSAPANSRLVTIQRERLPREDQE